MKSQEKVSDTFFSPFIIISNKEKSRYFVGNGSFGVQ
jgi:hypothetical protein